MTSRISNALQRVRAANVARSIQAKALVEALRVHAAVDAMEPPATIASGERDGWRWHVAPSLLTLGVVSVWAWDGQRELRGEVESVDAARDWVRSLRDGAAAWPERGALGDPVVGLIEA